MTIWEPSGAIHFSAGNSLSVDPIYSPYQTRRRPPPELRRRRTAARMRVRGEEGFRRLEEPASMSGVEDREPQVP
jgi:hypothetical protein